MVYWLLTRAIREGLLLKHILRACSYRQVRLILDPWTFSIPRDFDATIDKLHIRFLANSAGDTNTPTIDAAMYRKRAGAALSADIDPTISAAVNSNTDIADWVEIVSEGDEWQPGDVVTCLFTTSAHTTDALNLYDLEVVYASDLVYYNDDERSISDE